MALTENQRVAVFLEILGGPKYVSEMRAASAETRRLAIANRLAGREAMLASRRTFVMQQGIFTLRRYAFYGTLAITGMAVAVGKLGYEYLSAMQNARVALKPVIKDQGVLNGYLAQLFQISKYSPFVITDLAISFRQLFAGLHPLGIEGQQIINVMQALTDFMSFSGKTGPGQFQRLTLAIQHMAYAGRVTGYAVNQLSRLGLPVQAILRTQLGVSETDASRIARLNIPASAFIAAMQRYAKITPGIRNAARRMSLHTFSGLIQVARDTISQLSGGIIQGAYGGGQSFLARMFKPGSPFDVASQIANRKGPKGGGGAAIKYLSAQFTGSTGLGQGILLLTNILKNLGRVFVTILVPAFVLALHTLIIFWPLLKIVDITLRFMAKNAGWLKFVFAALAAEFVVTHFALLGIWTAQKLWLIGSFGSVKSIKSMIKWLKILRTVEMAGLITRWKVWAFRTVLGSRVIRENNSLFAKFSRVLFSRVFPALTAAASASWAFTASLLANPITWIVLAVVALTVGLVVLYFKWKKFHDLVDRTFNWFKNQSPLVQFALASMFGPIIGAAAALRYIIANIHRLPHAAKVIKDTNKKVTAGWFHPIMPFRFATGGLVGSRSVMVGEGGPEIAHLPFGTRISPADSVKSILNTNRHAGSDNLTLFSTIVMPNGKVLAEVVSKARQDKKATR